MNRPFQLIKNVYANNLKFLVDSPDEGRRKVSFEKNWRELITEEWRAEEAHTPYLFSDNIKVD